MRTSLATIAGLCILLSSARADTPKEKPELPLPKVEGWEKSDARPLPKESGRGYSVAYNCKEPHVAVTVYVYDRGLAEIPDDLASAAVKREFEGAKAAVHAAKKQGAYDEVKEEKSGESRLGGRDAAPKALHARFRTTIEKQELTSDLYVLSHRNQFVKIRVTRPADSEKAAKPRLDLLFDGIAKVLAAREDE